MIKKNSFLVMFLTLLTIVVTLFALESDTLADQTCDPTAQKYLFLNNAQRFKVNDQCVFWFSMEEDNPQFDPTFFQVTLKVHSGVVFMYIGSSPEELRLVELYPITSQSPTKSYYFNMFEQEVSQERFYVMISPPRGGSGEFSLTIESDLKEDMRWDRSEGNDDGWAPRLVRQITLSPGREIIFPLQATFPLPAVKCSGQIEAKIWARTLNEPLELYLHSFGLTKPAIRDGDYYIVKHYVSQDDIREGNIWWWVSVVNAGTQTVTIPYSETTYPRAQNC